MRKSRSVDSGGAWQFTCLSVRSSVYRGVVWSVERGAAPKCGWVICLGPEPVKTDLKVLKSVLDRDAQTVPVALFLDTGQLIKKV